MRLVLHLLWLFLIAVQLIRPVQAFQLFGVPAVNDEDKFMLAPRSMNRLLAEGRGAILQERYADGIAALYAVLQDESEALPPDEQGQDFFLARPPGDGVYNTTLKDLADSVLAELSPAGRETLQLQYGVVAQQELESAIADDDAERTAWVARNFPHTLASYDAYLVLAKRALVQGQLLTAARHYTRLLSYPHARLRMGPNLAKAAAVLWYQANRPNEAVKILSASVGYFPGQSIQLDGRQVELAADSDWLDLLGNAREVKQLEFAKPQVDNWTVAGGSPRRNAVANVGMPITTARWDRHIHSNTLERNALELLQDAEMQRGKVLLPKFELRMADNLVITKTTDNALLAIDFDNGKIVFPMHQYASPIGLTSQMGRIAPDELSAEMQNRVWGSSAYGQFSCDMDYIYVVVQSESQSQSSRSRVESNFLLAASIPQEGSRIWMAGSPGEIDPRMQFLSSDPLADAFFLGPPLPYEGVVYCIVEVRSQVQLVALDRDTGSLLWKQQLVSAPGFPRIGLNPQRSSQALSPTISDGIILCPTGVGAVVAVDLVTRRLAWAQAYEQSNGQTSLGQRSLGRSNSYEPLEPRWQDARITAEGGFMVLTPPESQELLGYDIFNGDLVLPENERQSCRYVVGIRKAEVVAVAEDRLVWFPLDNSSNRENATIRVGPAFPDSLSIAGRGVWSGDSLLLPLGEKTIARVNAQTGEVMEQVEVEQPVGNLFSYKNQLLSVSPTSVTAYYTREALSDRLARADTETAESLNQLSQLKMSEDDIDSAIGLLERALELEPDNDNSRYLIIEALLAGLSRDFDQYRQRAEKYESSLEVADQKFRFFQQLALGDIRSGRHLSAFQRLLELMGDRVGPTFASPRSQDALMELGEGYTVNSDAWISTNLARAYAKATPEQRTEIERLIELKLQDVDQRPVAYRRRELSFFAWLPAAHKHLVRLARDMQDLQTHTAAEALLQPIVAGEESLPETTAQALALLSTPPLGELEQLGALGLAGPQLLLENQLSGDERLEVLRENARPADVVWQAGQVTAVKTQVQRYQQGAAIWQLSERYGRADVCLAMSGERLIVYNALGEFTARINYARGIGDSDELFKQVSIRGGLIVLETLSEVIAFDLQRGLEGRTDSMLWRRSLRNQGTTANLQYKRSNAVSLPSELGFEIGRRQMPGNLPAAVGPLTVVGVPVQIGNQIEMLDSMSGKPLWTRAGFPNTLQFACDGIELATIMQQDETCLVRVFDCRDGTELRSFSTQRSRNQWLTHKAAIVDYQTRFDGTSTAIENPVDLRIWNPFTEQELLNLKLTVGSRAEQSNGNTIAIVEPGKGLHLIDIELLLAGDEAGHRVWEVPVNKHLETISVQRFEDQLVVLSNAREADGIARNEAPPQMNTLNAELQPVHGYVYGVDLARRELLWDEPGEIFNMLFPTIQPRQSPYMVTYSTQANLRANLAMLDLRSGSIMYYGSLNSENPSIGFAMALQPINQRIHVGIGTENMIFEVSDSPLSPQPIFCVPPR